MAAGDPPKAIKIGMTGRNDLGRRMRSIQSSNHERIRLLEVIEFLGGNKPAKRAEEEEKKYTKSLPSYREQSADS